MCTFAKANKMLAILMAFVMLFGATLSSEAAVNDVQPMYVNITKKSATATISGITLTGTAKLTTASSMSLSIKMECQKKKSGVYETVQTWTSSKTGTSLTMTKSRNINLLYDYRIKVTYTAGSETAVGYAYPA